MVREDMIEIENKLADLESELEAAYDDCQELEQRVQMLEEENTGLRVKLDEILNLAKEGLK